MIYFLCTALLLLGATLVSSCSDDLPTPPALTNSTPISKISINSSNEFVRADGSKIIPWGFNYTNPEGVGLIEDNWYDPGVWQLIQEDIGDMKSMGANIIRLHLQYHRFMIDVNTPNQQALDRLADLVEYAEDQHLYLTITGLAAYRKSDAPTFYDSLSDDERWATQAIFWKAVAETVGTSPAIFSYNLMNEPTVSAQCIDEVCEWTPGDGLGGLNFVQNITRTIDLPPANTLKSWIAQLSQSIRSVDATTPITTGFLALGPLSRFEDDLDYISTHIDYILANQLSTPLVLEEISNFMCSIEELEGFLIEIEGKHIGLLGHYFGRPIDELDRGQIIDAVRGNFYEFFVDNNPNI